jgi:C4-dicarboxylate transporter, DctQ subunit
VNSKRSKFFTIDTLDRIPVLVAGFTILLMALMATYATLQRYVFSMLPAIFYDEFTGYLLVVATWLAVGSSIRDGRFARVTVLTDRLPVKARRWLEIIANLGAIMVLGVLVWQGGKQALLSWQNGSRSFAAEVPFFIPQLFVPLGAFIAVILTLYTTIIKIILIIKK